MATAREEAERLVATALAAAQFASRAARSAQRNSGSGGQNARDTGNDMFEDLAGLANMASKFLGAGGFGGASTAPPRPASQPEKHHVISNGSDECCVCPLCRAIAAVRDPSPEFAERLATGASDLAAGATSILRAFGEAARRAGRRSENDDRAVVTAETVAPAGPVADRLDDAAVGGVPVTEPDAPESDVSEPDGSSDASGWPSWADFGNVWQAATRAQDEPVSAPQPAKKAMAKKAVAKKAVAKKTVAKKAVAKKAVAKKAVKAAADADLGSGPATEPAPSAPARKTPPAKKTAAKKTAARTAAAKKSEPAASRKTAAKKAAKKAPGAPGPKKAQ